MHFKHSMLRSLYSVGNRDNVCPWVRYFSPSPSANDPLFFLDSLSTVSSNVRPSHSKILEVTSETHQVSHHNYYITVPLVRVCDIHV